MRTGNMLSAGSVLLGLFMAGCGENTAADSRPIQVQVTVTPSDENGVVVSEPAGLVCGTTCSALFAAGTPVRLSATPPPGMELIGWQGACQGAAASCEFTATEDARISVQYRKIPPTRALLVTKSGTGTGTITSDRGGVACGDSCSARVSEGSQVVLSVSADDASIFTGWSGACTGTALTCTVTVNGDLAVSAGFGKPQSCAQIKDSHPSAASGTFKLFVGGDSTKPWDAYCVLANPVATYLPLVNTTTGNFSQYTAGGGRPGNTVRTTFQRVRIDPILLAIDPGDLSASISVGLINLSDGGKITQMAYGSAADCVATNSMSGVGNVDLSGTPFAVAPNAFVTSGYIAAGSATYSTDGRIVNLRGGGFCGGTAVRTGTNTPYDLQLVYKP